MERYEYKQPRKKRQRKTGKRRGGAVVLLIAAGLAMVFGVSLFFKVANIEVAGENRCAKTDVIKASGLQLGDSMLFYGRKSAIRQITANQPYVDTASIKMKNLNTIEIRITECEPAAFIVSDGAFWIIDVKGKLLEKRLNRPEFTEIKGLKLLVPIEGTAAAVGDTDHFKLAPLLYVLELFSEEGIEASEITYDTVSGISFRYQKRFTVKLGVPAALDMKLRHLPEVVESLEPNAAGTIDLTDVENKKSRFIPD